MRRGSETPRLVCRADRGALLEAALDISGVGRSVTCDVDLHRFCLRFRKVSNACRLGIEAAGWQRSLGIGLHDGAVTEVSHTAHDHCAAVVTMRVRLDTGIRRNGE